MSDTASILHPPFNPTTIHPAKDNTMNFPSGSFHSGAGVDASSGQQAPGAGGSIRPARNLDELSRALSGTLVRPDDAQWDAARAAWQLLVDQQPVAVVTAASRQDISLTMKAAAALGLRVAPQSTGHNAAPLGDLARTILLRTSSMNRVLVDAGQSLAHVESGALWGQVSEAAAAAGLTAVGGFSADVGVVGTILGGGLGWFARSHGAASSSVLALEAITADGGVHHVDAASELFEAILGGADVAVVTAVTLRLHSVAEMTAGALFWPVQAARGIFHAWAGWSAGLPESVTSLVRVLRFPNAPDVPPVFAGRAFAVVEVAAQAGPAESDVLLQPLRALAPEVDTVAPAAPGALFALHMDPPAPVRALSTTALQGALPAPVLDALADAILDGPASVLTSIELRHLGGALDRGRETAATGSHSLLYAVAVAPAPTHAVAPNPAAIAAAKAALAALREAVEPVRSLRDVGSLVEDPTADAGRIFGPRLQTLRAAKDRWDPSNAIHANHSVADSGTGNG